MNEKKSEVLGPGELIDKFESRGDQLPQETGAVSMVQMAMQRGYDPELISKMMDLQERNEAKIAKQAYNKAMSAFKANPPKIWKDIQVKYEVGNKVTEWSHADLATAAEVINKSLGENGLNSTWRTLPLEDNKTRVTCIITHELGHSEETYLEAGPDDTGSKNKIQALGSTIFYLERYTLFALTGLAPARMDNGGKGAGEIKYIAEEQVKIIELLAEETNSDVPKWMEVESIDKILAKDFKKAESGLRAKVKKQRQPGK